MGNMLSGIGNFFQGSTGKALTSIAGLGATGAGLVGNLLADKQRSDAAALAKRNANLTPAQLSGMVNQATQPLNANLVQAITGNVNANMAEQGLSQAPGLMQTALAQALAGPEQAQQQLALQLVMQKLGLPAEYAKLIPQNANLAPGIAMVMKSLGSFPGANPTPQPLPGYAMPNPNPAQLSVGPDFANPDTSGTYDFGNLIPPNYGGTLGFGA